MISQPPRAEDFTLFRRFRPWMWGPLRHLWMMYWGLDEPKFTHYRWKTGQDRKILARLNECCGHPDGRGCWTHRYKGRT